MPTSRVLTGVLTLHDVDMPGMSCWERINEVRSSVKNLLALPVGGEGAWFLLCELFFTPSNSGPGLL